MLSGRQWQPLELPALGLEAKLFTKDVWVVLLRWKQQGGACSFGWDSSLGTRSQQVPAESYLSRTGTRWFGVPGTGFRVMTSVPSPGNPWSPPN